MKNKINLKECAEIIIPKKSREAFDVGYLDGYFNEEAYFSYIECELFFAYSSGYAFGAEKRKHTDLEKIKFNKELWITQLAINDAVNFNFERKISDEYMELYNLHFCDVINGLGCEVSSNYFEELVKQGLAVVDQSSSWGYRFIDKSNVKVRK